MMTKEEDGNNHHANSSRKLNKPVIDIAKGQPD
jgi:hypothetical protein